MLSGGHQLLGNWNASEYVEAAAAARDQYTFCFCQRW
jgi:hypothetical protein